MIALTTALLTLAFLGTPTIAAQIAAPADLSDRVNEALGLARSDVFRLREDDVSGAAAIIPVRIGNRLDVLYLAPHSVRAKGYEVLAQGDDGTLTRVEPGPERTLRGVLLGTPGSAVAASIADDGLHARILTPEGEYWIEPLVGRVAGAEPGDHVSYASEDVVEEPGRCSLDALPDARAYAPILGADARATPDGQGESGTTALGGPLMVAELGCDADYEFYAAFGSIAAVEIEINSIVNAINVQYEMEVGLQHAITTIIVRTSPVQPYLSTDPYALLSEVKSEWTTAQAGVPRDVAHLFTGKELDGNVIGIAWLGVVCNSSYGYGLSESTFSGNFACVTDLTAHELGHNWNAGHCSCTGNTMNPWITCANTFHPVETVPDITAFRDSLNCLDEDSGGDPGDPQDDVVSLATGDASTAKGKITAGSYLSTHAQDDVVEALMEGTTGGKPSKRKSLLNHVWTFNVAPGPLHVFFLDAYHSDNQEGDDFVFSYSRDGSNFLPLLTVSKTTDDDTLQSAPFPEDVGGTLWIRVQDTNGTPGNSVLNSVFVDEMFVLTDLDGVDSVPPLPPSGLVATAGDATVSLDWADNAETDLDGYVVHRALNPGGPHTVLGAASVSNFVDVTVLNGQTYFYVVTATDATGNESSSSGEASATPQDPGAGPQSVSVSGITVSSVSEGKGQKRGRAVVTVVDNLGGPVAGALVTGTFTGGLAETVAASTDATGSVVLETTGTKKGGLSLTFCVDDVQASGLVYQSSDNAETCDSN